MAVLVVQGVVTKGMESRNDMGELVKPNGYDTENKEYISCLPKSIKRRIQALKKLQVEGINVEAHFYERVHQLEVEFAPMFSALHNKRKAIVTGNYEPTDDEADFPILRGYAKEEIEQMEEASSPEPKQPTKGIPNFWLHLLKNVDHICEMIQEHDEPILKHLIDITCDVQTNPDSYTLTFHFEPNEYFAQTELKKYYTLQVAPDEDDVFDYDGPVIINTKGTEIDWKDGKNVTKKVIKKKQKKGTSAGRFITKTVKADSFFNFFDPPPMKNKNEINEDDDDDVTEELLQADFEVGQLFRDQIVPRAVLFYTKEAIEDNDIFEYDGDEDEDETELGDDSDN
uniref:Nucleosome assembly protein n=2 Tax=Onchocerca TaxID=6281 RepID=A0A8R1Y2Q7_ONCVO